MTNFVDLWVYLSGSPLLWLTTTLIAYLAADAISAACGRHPLANPVLIAVTFVSIIVVATGTPFSGYFAGAQFVHFLLGPATVALAVPLVRYLSQVRRALVPMLAALIAGSVTAIVCAVWLAEAFGLDRAAILALAPKSATAAIAMGIAEKMGGDPALTAVLTILAGITGAIIVTPLMNALRLRNYAARGFAAGLTSHGIGTARLPGRSAGRNLRRHRPWPQRLADGTAGAAAIAMAVELTRSTATNTTNTQRRLDNGTSHRTTHSATGHRARSAPRARARIRVARGRAAVEPGATGSLRTGRDAALQPICSGRSAGVGLHVALPPLPQPGLPGGVRRRRA